MELTQVVEEETKVAVAEMLLAQCLLDSLAVRLGQAQVLKEWVAVAQAGLQEFSQEAVVPLVYQLGHQEHTVEETLLQEMQTSTAVAVEEQVEEIQTDLQRLQVVQALQDMQH
jgi:uncharacterized protein (DUF934 family)